MRADLASGVVARVYEVLPETSGVSLRLAEAVLQGVAITDGELVGPVVTIGSRCVLVEASPQGELRGAAMDPLSWSEDGLLFDPCAGGVRTRENRRAAGAHNRQIAEATRFGMVNAFHHVGLAASRLNGLLRELGAPPLPHLKVVVGAHAGSRLPGYCQGDGDFRRGHMLPFSGGHYRLSQRTSGLPEMFPVSPTGEVHLGPGRRRQRFAGQDSYLPNAAHNPATIYHEYGHHLCRHTADFRLNGERSPSSQRNGKTAVEEGICDYLAAAILGTGRPYGWFRPVLGQRRDPENEHGLDEGCAGDVHAEGAVWAGILWRIRQELLEDGLLDSPPAHDRAVVAALLEVGTVAAHSRDGRPRRLRQAERCAPITMMSAYLGAIREAGGPAAVACARRSFRAVGLSGLADLPEGVSAC